MKHIAIKKKKNIQENWKLINIIVIADIILSFPYYISQLSQLLNAGVSSAAYKLLIVKGEVDSGGAMIQFLIRPMEFIILSMSAYSFFNFNRKNKIVAYSGIYICVLKYLCTGSRSVFVYYTLCMFVMYFYSKNKPLSKSKKKNNIKIKALISSLVLSFCIAFSTSGNIFKSLYIYIAGCIPFFDQVVNNDYYWEYGLTYGYMSFNGIIRFFNHFLRILGINLDLNLFKIAEDYLIRLQNGTNIGTNITYNAFSTFISNFYIDFSFFGVIALSFAFGIFCCYVYKRYENTKNIFTFSLLMLVFNFVLYSIVSFQLSHTVLAMSLIYSFILLKLSRLKINIKALR